MSSNLFLFLSIFSLWSGLGYASTLNSYFFVFVCHYSLRITSRAEYIHTQTLLRRRRSRSKKKEARLFHSLRRRAFPTLGEKSRNRPFFLSRFLSTRRLSFTNTRRAVEHQRSSLTGKRSLSSFRAVKAFFLSRSRRKNVSLFVILSFQL
jgi:hypothetical protein